MALCAILLAGSRAGAQLVLPGAIHAAEPSSGGTANPHANPVPGVKNKPKPIGLKPPGEETIIGRDLVRNGSTGAITFARGADRALTITRLSLAGEEISAPSEQCRVDVIANQPITPRFADRPAGVSRYEVDLAACPFSFDVLNGAVFISREKPECDFVAADCRVDPTGLWGPPGDSIGDKEAKAMEHARPHAESNVRANFRAVLASAGKDKTAIKTIAAEQAGFSSEREVACRNYAREEVHGFCALRMTEARALALEAKYNEMPRNTRPQSP